MSRYLIDTQVFIWMEEASRRLTPTARTILRDGDSSLFISLVTPWEITIKTAKGKMPRGDDYLAQFDRAIAEEIVTLLTPGPDDIKTLRQLPRLHGDPFDRLLIAQAKTAGLPILSSDKQLAEYELPVIW